MSSHSISAIWSKLTRNWRWQRINDVRSCRIFRLSSVVPLPLVADDLYAGDVGVDEFHFVERQQEDAVAAETGNLAQLFG